MPPRQTAKEMLAALYSSDAQHEKQQPPQHEKQQPPQHAQQPPVPPPPGPGRPCGLLELSDELLHEVLLRVAADEPAGLGKLERVAAHLWRPRRPLPRSDDEPSDTVLPRGARVVVHGCRSEAGQALNGRAATVHGFDAAAGRYMLAVAGVERRKKLQGSNITRAASAPEVAAAAAVSRRGDRWRVWRRRGESWKRALHLLQCCLPPLRRLSCGSMHTVAADAAGTVWSWGLGMSGQLGHGRRAAEPGAGGRGQSSEDDDDALATTERERKRWAGLTHTSLLQDEKELRPRRVSFGGSTPVAMQSTPAAAAVVAGGSSTLALVAGTGELWSWGRLAHRAGSAEDRVVASPSPRLGLAMPPSKAHAGAGQVVSVVSVRDNHAALVTDRGTLFTWGEGSQGQLGHGQGLDYDSPREVDFGREAIGPSPRLSAAGTDRLGKARQAAVVPRITNVACSSFATMILTEHGQL